MSQRRIPVIGIVGGIGSGKSAVAKWVAEHARAALLDADKFGHLALRDAKVKEALRQRFGDQIIGQDGEIVRSILAREVFGVDAVHLQARHDLEQIVHPEIGRQISEGIGAAANEQQQAVLLDAAVLLEAGWRNKCDIVVYIDTPDKVRLARVCENRGWSEAELRQREASQWTLMEKRREADLIVTNDRDVESAGKQLLQMLESRGLIKS